MASIDYSSTYLRTHELGMSYNLLESPAGVAGGASVGSTNTNTNFYAMLAVAGALVNTNRSRILDLSIDGSQSNYSAAHAATPSTTR
ncbi:glycoside hydrolase family 79 protein [Phanerochaete carnosa HHB-10118-sp]|uniref:Glycoside hydrolase family 79 protein n=1 Tax=Phanerochaete carnosa (strain HHB-10118-sp) TaxID=650164 RepID=K5WI52_PHACS|nr:glycoside hydrolase family 79 protein [Phanerochaete carnosa HHB-10118-sp]EKM49897.1 glycoside hydrolase family 79 protein [Phanerochaete carnosa HHB-10118-sp]